MLKGLRSTVTRGMERALYDIVDAVFTISQRNVPVDRGTLKKSGTIRKLHLAAEIAYRTPYAAAVHEGVREHDERVQRHYVRPHRRKIGGPAFTLRRTRAGLRMSVRQRGGQVTGHFRGPFERHVKERPGRPWLQDAVDEVRPRFGQIIGRALARTVGR